MKLLLVVFITLFSLNAQATYLRTIRIGSFPNEKTAQAALEELNQFVAAHPNIVKLQEEWDFEFKQRKSGKYYITLAEPFRDRKVLQEVLDTLRIEYPDVYVTRLKTYKSTKKTKKTLENTAKQDHSVAVMTTKKDTAKPQQKLQEEDTQQEEQTTSQDLEITSVITEPEIITSEPSTVADDVTKIDQHKSFDYKTAFFFALGFGLLSLVFMLYYRRKNNMLENKELITQEKFRQMMLEVQNKEKLISYVSHELRSPMTAIIGLTNLVLESNLSKLQKDYVEKIEKSSNYILNLINDILDLSKIQANKLTIEQVEFNINDILNYVYNIVSIQAKHNNINISINVDKDVPSHVVGDSLRVGQILINLLSNAVKFTKNGEVSLSVHKIESFGDNVTLEFNVSDTGIGMSQDQVEKLFNSYYQADPSISREFGGTGLGLSISKHLIEMMHGEIRVQSKKGVGTTFTFNIRFGLKDSQNKRQYRLPSGKLLNKKILIVDSSNKNAIPLMQALGYFHYTTRNIPSFERIGEDLSHEAYDIIIINLNNLTDRAIKKIKEFKKNKKTKVVVFSELHTSLNETTLHDLVIDGYLKPPVTIQSVLDMIVDLYMNKEKKAPKKLNPFKEKLRRFSGKKLLVVEDNELNHKVIAGMLAKTGIELSFVENGQKAIDLLQKGARIDLILMDINMPVLDGIGATKQLRANGYTKPIVSLSANVIESDIKSFKEAGCNDTLNKPIIPQDLDVILSRYLEKQTQQEEEETIQEEFDTIELESIASSLGLQDTAIIKKLLKSLQNTLEGIKKDIENGVFDKDLLHKLKGSVGNMRFYNLYNLANDLEENVSTLSENEITQAKQRIILHIDSLIRQITAL